MLGKYWKSLNHSDIQIMKLKGNLKKHISIKNQIFLLLRKIKQLLIHKLFIHLGYLILIQQVLLRLIGVKAKMINKKIVIESSLNIFYSLLIFLVLYKYSFLFNTDY